MAIAALGKLPTARLRLVGLREVARREGVTERVEIPGAVPSGQVVEALSRASAGLALIQPICLSYELSLPNKLFEYVLAGVPVLGSELPVSGAFAREHGVGLLARPDDPADVAGKLAQTRKPGRNRELRAAARAAAKGLRWEPESERFAEAYASARAASGRAG